MKATAEARPAKIATWQGKIEREWKGARQRLRGGVVSVSHNESTKWPRVNIPSVAILVNHQPKSLHGKARLRENAKGQGRGCEEAWSQQVTMKQQSGPE